MKYVKEKKNASFYLRNPSNKAYITSLDYFCFNPYATKIIKKTLLYNFYINLIKKNDFIFIS